MIVCCLLVVFSSCKKKETTIPNGVLDPMAMADLLADLHTVQAAASIHAAKDTTFVPFAAYAPALFRNHGITEAVYDSSLAFYTHHPELLDSIYKEVIEELSRRQGLEAGSRK